MLLVGLALAAVNPPASESGLWTEIVAAAGLGPADDVVFERIDVGYRIRVRTADGTRTAVARGAHDAANREDAARLAKSLLVSARDPLAALAAPAAPREESDPVSPAGSPAAAPKARSAKGKEERVAPVERTGLSRPAGAGLSAARLTPFSSASARPLAAVRSVQAFWEADHAADLVVERWPRARTPWPLVLGVGVQEDLAGGATLDGVQLSLKAQVSPTWSVELGVYSHLPWVAAHDASDDAVLEVTRLGDPSSAFELPVTVDGTTVDALADCSFLPMSGRWGGGPHAQAGISLRDRQDQVGTLTDGEVTWSAPTSRFAPGIAGGLAVEAWYEARLGLRARALARISSEPAPDYDATVAPSGAMELTASTALSLDLLVRL